MERHQEGPDTMDENRTPHTHPGKTLQPQGELAEGKKRVPDQGSRVSLVPDLRALILGATRFLAAQ